MMAKIPLTRKDGIIQKYEVDLPKYEKKTGFQPEIWDLNCKFGTSKEEFEHYVGRKPKKGEMDDWVHYLEKGVEAQLDWDIINTCAADEIKER
jgi:transposase